MNVDESHMIVDDLIDDLSGSEFNKSIEEDERLSVASVTHVTQYIMEDDPIPDEDIVEDDTQDEVYF